MSIRPIKPISSDSDYDAALEEIESLFASEPGSEDADRLEVLVVLAQDYQRMHDPVGPPRMMLSAFESEMDWRGFSRRMPMEFLEMLPNAIPGYLAIFNLADTKRRNSYLDIQEVDRDIEECDRLARRLILPSGLVQRIGGDEWALFLPAASPDFLVELLALYQKQVWVSVGWECRATKRWHRPKQAASIKEAWLYRTARCCYAKISNSTDLAATWKAMMVAVGRLQPGVPICLDDLDASYQANRWQCVDDHVENQDCPFCRGHDYEHDEDDSVGSMFRLEAACRKCGAAVEFTQVFEIKSPRELSADSSTT